MGNRLSFLFLIAEILATACGLAHSGEAGSTKGVVAVTATFTENRQKCDGVRCWFEKVETVSRGNGIILGKTRDGEAVIATAGHVVEGPRSKDLIVRVGCNGEWYSARVAKSQNSDGIDLAILAARIPDYYGTVHVADARPGQRVWFNGWMPDREWLYRTGKIEEDKRWLTLSHPFVQGESGGPVWDESGNLVGIAGATDYGHTSWMTGSSVLLEWVPSLLVAKVSANCYRPASPSLEPSPQPSSPTPLVPIPETEPLPVAGPQVIVQQGPRGPQGERGPQGPKGDRGERGEQGPPGECRCDRATVIEQENRIAILQGQISVLRAEVQAMKSQPITLDIRKPVESIPDGVAVEELPPVKRETVYARRSATGETFAVDRSTYDAGRLAIEFKGRAENRDQ